MKVVLDLKLDREPKENDVIVFQNNVWKVISKESFFAKHIIENRQSFKSIDENERKLDEKIDKTKEKLEKDIQKLQKDLIAIAKIVKEK